MSQPRANLSFEFHLSPIGKELQTINVPAKRTTSCCWGGKGFDEMYITCARFGMTDEEKIETPLAGSIFKATGLGIKGIPAYVFEGLN